MVARDLYWKARNARIRWKDKHFWETLFRNPRCLDDPEYETLWEREIGAEDFRSISFGDDPDRGDGASWQEYIDERRWVESQTK